jgi:hypothetical protein
VWRGGQAIAIDRHESEIALEMDEAPAVYRVEIRAPNRPGASPWILGNPIYVRDPGVVSGGLPARPSATDSAPLFNGRNASGWSLEQDATSLSALDVTPRVIGAELRFRYGLSGDPAPGPYAGIMVDTPQGLDRYDRVSFTVRAEHPMRISVQVRTERSDGAPERWQRSVYIDAEDREATVFFDTMTPVGATIASRVPAAAVRKLMFIVDRTNSKPASFGRIWLRDVKLLR